MVDNSAERKIKTQKRENTNDLAAKFQRGARY